MNKRHPFVVFLMLLACLFVSAHSWAITPEIKLSVEGGNYPVVRGKTNLPDGMEMTVSLVVPGQYLGQSNVTVKNGAFSSERFTVNGVGPIPPGQAIIVVQSPLLLGAPKSVTEVTGKYGENINGPLVFTIPGLSGRMVKTSIRVEIP